MKKTVLTALLTTAIISYVNAQKKADTTWKLGTAGNIAFSQVSLTNWAAGGENSYATEMNFSFFTHYNQKKTTWDNNLELGYGFLKIIDDEMKKTNDVIDLESRFGYSAGKKWHYSAMFNFKTQFAEGYKYEENSKTFISDFLAPAYLIAALGMDYKPNDNFTLLLSPITGKTTYVGNDSLSAEGAYGVKKGEKWLHEYGGFIKMRHKVELAKNIRLQNKADFFSAYNNKPENIDVNWEAILEMKVTKYFATLIKTHLIYDHDTKVENDDGSLSPKIQFKEIFGFGINYKFPAETNEAE
jgi:hypothetical protein